LLEQVVGLLQQRGWYQADRKVSGRCRTGCRWLGLVAAIDGPADSAGEAEEGTYPLLGLLASGQILEPDPQARTRVLAFEGEQGTGGGDPVGGKAGDRVGRELDGERREYGVGDAPRAGVQDSADNVPAFAVQAQEPGPQVQAQECLGDLRAGGGYLAPAWFPSLARIEVMKLAARAR
jgi:hypothetical protein